MRKISCLLLVVTITLLSVSLGCRPAQDDEEEDNSPINTHLETLQALIKEGDAVKALIVFKTVEPRLERGEPLYKAWLYFALHAVEMPVRAEYAEKISGFHQLAVSSS